MSRITVGVRWRGLPVDRALLRRAAASHAPPAGDLEILVLDDAAIRALNRDHLGHDWATDVVTFPLGPPGPWGALAVSGETARREARRRGVPFDRELALYVAHGALHLHGLDDRTPAQRRRMRAAERRALARLFPGDR